MSIDTGRSRRLCSVCQVLVSPAHLEDYQSIVLFNPRKEALSPEIGLQKSL
jgi:hypothetical protein